MEDADLKAAIEKVLSENRSKFGFGTQSDARPTDADVFFSLLPTILGGYIMRGGDARSSLSSAFVAAREAAGHCCAMGVARVATICSDGSHLAVTPQGMNVPGVVGAISANQDPTQRGVVVAQYATAPNGGIQTHGGVQAPGPGGMIAQYPTNAPGGGVVQHVGGGQIGTPTGNGMRGVVVAMHPNDPNIHPIATAPQQQQQAPQFPQIPPQPFSGQNPTVPQGPYR